MSKHISNAKLEAENQARKNEYEFKQEILERVENLEKCSTYSLIVGLLLFAAVAYLLYT